MPRHIMKPIAGEDFYVEYSTVVDSPVDFGPRDQFGDEERLERVDATGTSALWGTPPFLGWEDKKVMVREGIVDPTRPKDSVYGEVKREDLRVFCESVRDDGLFHPPAGIVSWVVDPEEGNPMTEMEWARNRRWLDEQIAMCEEAVEPNDYTRGMWMALMKVKGRMFLTDVERRDVEAARQEMFG